ncbi:MAG: chaperone modulator CbpM [Rhodocyclaceae bacterium]|nr:chaperone modulator CbpM [Rhodocyclaceae bacterium]
MSKADMQLARGPVVEEEIQLTLMELCQACGAAEEHVIAWVYEGVLEPLGDGPQKWHFTGQSLRRTRVALRLTRDLEVNPPGIALALDLLDEIAALQAQLQRAGMRCRGK